MRLLYSGCESVCMSSITKSPAARSAASTRSRMSIDSRPAKLLPQM